MEIQASLCWNTSRNFTTFNGFEKQALVIVIVVKSACELDLQIWVSLHLVKLLIRPVFVRHDGDVFYRNIKRLIPVYWTTVECSSLLYIFVVLKTLVFQPCISSRGQVYFFSPLKWMLIQYLYIHILIDGLCRI